MTTTEVSQLTPWQQSVAIEYTPMAERIATREWKNKYREVLTYEDTQSLAYLGLVKACSHCEPGRDGLVTYFERYMVGEIQEHLRRIDHAPRRIRGLINKIPKDMKIEGPEQLMKLLSTPEKPVSEKDAATIISVLHHGVISLQGMAASTFRDTADTLMGDDWENVTLLQSSPQLESEAVEDTWLDDQALCQAVSYYISCMDLTTQAIIVLNYVENFPLSKLPQELGITPSLAHKLHESAVQNVRNFVTSWIVAA